MRKSPSARERHGYLLIHRLRSSEAEAYRVLRTNIQFASVDKQLRSLVFTSALPGEGKSLTVANFAIVMAQAGKRVLLIDADMRKPTAHLYFKTWNHRGLSNLLVKQESPEELIQSTLVDNLYLLPSGPIPPNPVDLLGSIQMQELFISCKTNFDLVLFDSPPVLTMTDAQILASYSDGVVLVIKAGKTKKDLVRKAKNLLENVHANILGAVLNERKMDDLRQYHYPYME